MKAETKYKESVSLYAETGLSIKEICERTGVGYSAFSSYLCKHFRELILKRHNLTDYTTVRLRGKKGQTTAAHYKYKDAIAACDSTEYIEYNISQIARIFGVDCTSLSNQLRRHYPDIVPRREQERRRLGGFRYYLRTWYPHLMVERRGYGEGVDLEQTKRYRKSTAEKYADAIERLKATDLPTAKVAAEFGLNPETFRMYLKEHCPELAVQRGMTKAAGGKLVSRRSQEKYAEAIRLYETTPDSLKSIAARLGLVYKSLGGYIRRNHPGLLKHGCKAKDNKKTQCSNPK